LRSDPPVSRCKFYQRGAGMKKWTSADRRFELTWHSKDELAHGLVAGVRLLIVLFCLFLLVTIEFYIDFVLSGRSISMARLLPWSALETCVKFAFVLVPILYAMRTRGRVMSYFMYAALGLMLYYFVLIGMALLSGLFWRQHGYTLFIGGVPTLVGLLRFGMELLLTSLLIALCLRASERLVRSIGTVPAQRVESG
jgi:hypothetical protein